MSNLWLYVVTVLIWGSTWIAINFQLGVVPLTLSIFYRYAIAAALLMLWCLLRRKRLRYGFAAHRIFAGLGLLLFGLNYVAAYAAQLYISSALNALMFSCLVWMNILNARLFLGVRSPANVYLGAALGVVGIALLFWPELGALSWQNALLVGGIISFLGALSASLGNVLAQYGQQRHLPVVESNAWGMFYGAAFIGALCLLTNTPLNFDWSVTYVSSLLFLAVFGSILGFGAYLTLVGRLGANRAGYVVVMFPVVATLLAVVFEGLQMTPWMIAGMGLILGGNGVIMGRRAAPPQAVLQTSIASQVLRKPGA